MKKLISKISFTLITFILFSFIKTPTAFANASCFDSNNWPKGDISIDRIDTHGHTLPSNGDQIDTYLILTNGCPYPTGENDVVFAQYSVNGAIDYFNPSTPSYTIQNNIAANGGQVTFILSTSIKSGVTCQTSGQVKVWAGVQTLDEGPFAITQSATSTNHGLGAIFWARVQKSDNPGSWIRNARVSISNPDYTGEYGGSTLYSANNGDYYEFKGLICTISHTLTVSNVGNYQTNPPNGVTLTGTNTAGDSADICNADVRAKDITVYPIPTLTFTPTPTLSTPTPPCEVEAVLDGECADPFTNNCMRETMTYYVDNCAEPIPGLRQDQLCCEVNVPTPTGTCQFALCGSCPGGQGLGNCTGGSSCRRVSETIQGACAAYDWFNGDGCYIDNSCIQVGIYRATCNGSVVDLSGTPNCTDCAWATYDDDGSLAFFNGDVPMYHSVEDGRAFTWYVDNGSGPIQSDTLSCSSFGCSAGQCTENCACPNNEICQYP